MKWNLTCLAKSKFRWQKMKGEMVWIVFLCVMLRAVKSEQNMNIRHQQWWMCRQQRVCARRNQYCWAFREWIQKRMIAVASCEFTFTLTKINCLSTLHLIISSLIWWFHNMKIENDRDFGFSSYFRWTNDSHRWTDDRNISWWTENTRQKSHVNHAFSSFRLSEYNCRLKCIMHDEWNESKTSCCVSSINKKNVIMMSHGRAVM